MYLANDVIQNSKKKGPEYGKEFGNILKRAFEHIAEKGIDDKTKSSLSRLLKIWNDRGVYDDAQIADFKSALSNTKETYFAYVFIKLLHLFCSYIGGSSKEKN